MKGCSGLIHGSDFGGKGSSKFPLVDGFTDFKEREIFRYFIRYFKGLAPLNIS